MSATSICSHVTMRTLRPVGVIDGRGMGVEDSIRTDKLRKVSFQVRRNAREPAN